MALWPVHPAIQWTRGSSPRVKRQDNCVHPERKSRMNVAIGLPVLPLNGVDRNNFTIICSLMLVR